MHGKARGAVVAALGLAAAGCGGGGGTSHPAAAGYVHTVCGAVKTFETSLQAQAQQLQSLASSSSSRPDPASLKVATAKFLGQAKTDSDNAANAIDKAGSPKVKDGATVQRTLVSAFRKLSAGYDADQRKVQALDAGNPATFSQQLDAIARQSEQLGTSIGSSLSSSSGLGGQELTAAGKKDATCQSLGGS